MGKYRVSKFIDEIKKVVVKDEDFATTIVNNAFYEYFETYDEAKSYLVNRCEMKIVNLSKEIKRLEKKLPKLVALKERHLKLSDKIKHQ